MDSTALAEFNTLKAAANTALYPASVRFAHLPAMAGVTVSFGEVANQGGLHESGRFADNDRRATCLFPIASLPAGLTPQLGHILLHLGTGEQWLIIDPLVSHPREPVIRFALVQVRPRADQR